MFYQTTIDACTNICLLQSIYCFLICLGYDLRQNKLLACLAQSDGNVMRVCKVSVHLFFMMQLFKYLCAYYFYFVSRRSFFIFRLRKQLQSIMIIYLSTTLGQLYYMTSSWILILDHTQGLNANIKVFLPRSYYKTYQKCPSRYQLLCYLLFKILVFNCKFSNILSKYSFTKVLKLIFILILSFVKMFLDV